jgi:hypothetical protein
VGLDITAYKQLTEVADQPGNEDGFVDDNLFHVDKVTLKWTERNFPGRTAGLNPDTFYDFEDSFGFRAGSYSGYNSWRNWLATVAGFDSADAVWNSAVIEGPFVELINFADNEGFIGPIVAAKLAKDFADHEAKAAKAATDAHEGWYIEVYRDWKKAFEMAADNGAVDFH